MAPKEKLITTEEEFEVWLLLSQVRKELLMASDRELKKRFGISTVQLGIIHALYAADEAGISISLSDLSRQVLRKHNTVSVILNGMEERGLIKIERDNENRRSISISLTDDGRAVFRETEAKRKNIKLIIGSLTAKERAQLVALLKKIDQKARDILYQGPYS